MWSGQILVEWQVLNENVDKTPTSYMIVFDGVLPNFFQVEDHRNGSYGVSYSPFNVGMHKVDL